MPPRNSVPVFNKSLTAVHHVTPDTLQLHNNNLGTAAYVDHLARPAWMRHADGSARRHFHVCDMYFHCYDERRPTTSTTSPETASACCVLGASCPDVHVPRSATLSSSPVHVNRPEALSVAEHDASMTAAFPPGSTVAVYDAASGRFESCASDMILWTKGSRDLTSGVSGGRRVFHCTHFRNKGMCLQGPSCAFMHVVMVPLTQQQHQHQQHSDGNLASQPQQAPQQQVLLTPDGALVQFVQLTEHIQQQPHQPDGAVGLGVGSDGSSLLDYSHSSNALSRSVLSVQPTTTRAQQTVRHSSVGSSLGYYSQQQQHSLSSPLLLQNAHNMMSYSSSNIHAQPPQQQQQQWFLPNQQQQQPVLSQNMYPPRRGLQPHGNTANTCGSSTDHNNTFNFNNNNSAHSFNNSSSSNGSTNNNPNINNYYNNHNHNHNNNNSTVSSSNNSNSIVYLVLNIPPEQQLQQQQSYLRQ
eukprot:PhM_4_TR18803/c1_g1_i2/m.91590